MSNSQPAKSSAGDPALNPYESPKSMEFARETVTVDREYLESVERRLVELEKRVVNNWLLSPRFLVRSFAVFGYGLVGYFLIAMPFYVIGLVIVIIVSAFS